MDNDEQIPEGTLSCRSQDGITTGLVDAIIAILRILAKRDLSPGEVQAALADLKADCDLRTVLEAAPAEESA